MKSLPRAALALAQAGVYGGLAWQLSSRGALDAGLLATAAVGQLVACGAAARGAARPLAISAWVSLGAVGVEWGRLLAQARQINEVFGPDPGWQAWQVVLGSLVALPWVFALPVEQLFAARSGRSSSVLALLILPVLVPQAHPPASDPARATAAARWLWPIIAARTTPDAAASLGASTLAPDTVLQLTVLRRGQRDPATTTVTTVAEAPAVVTELAEDVRPGDGRVALLVDVQTGPVPGSWVRPGADAPCVPAGERSGVSPVLYVRTQPRLPVLPGLSLPRTTRPICRFDSAVASAAGVTPLVDGWSPVPELDAATALASAVAGAGHLAHNLHDDGRFTYIVTGPSGASGKGYNYPRHAGTAWFLARVALAAGDTSAGEAADRALAHLDTVSEVTPDGRRYILDPDRRDGKSWIGTTALAVLAQVARAPAVSAPARLLGWADQLVASVDADGKVLGEMQVRTGTFIADQPANAYGQGQTMLALATLAAHPELLDGPARITAVANALARTTGYLAQGYYGTEHPLYVADEHWMCLTAHALAATPGGRSAAADGICATYVAQETWNHPHDGMPRPAAGPAGGAAEAVVARAWDAPGSVPLDTVRAYGTLFLRSQYRPADIALLGDGAALLGGYRDSAGDLDVQIDAVQHIGGALLGVAALLSGHEQPGSFP